MLIVTGSAGFIGSQVAQSFDHTDRMLLVDNPDFFRKNGYFGPHEPTIWDKARDVDPDPKHNVIDYRYFPQLLKVLQPEYTERTKTVLPTGESIQAIIHIGAITDTSKDCDPKEMEKWNTEYSKTLWRWCAEHGIPFVYASSAATYGLGNQGFSDDHDKISSLQPLNPYAISKQAFDLWAVEELKAGNKVPPQWWGLKFFNVYGPQEGHKGRMASTVLHSYRSIEEQESCPLFRSHRDDIKDGEQKRDFIHVSDLVKVIHFLLEKKPESGIYNVGTGKARSFFDMANALFQSVEKPTKIDWIDTPTQFREFYQYFTEADLTKLREAGYEDEFLTLESGISSYVSWLKSDTPKPNPELMH